MRYYCFLSILLCDCNLQLDILTQIFFGTENRREIGSGSLKAYKLSRQLELIDKWIDENVKTRKSYDERQAHRHASHQ